MASPTERRTQPAALRSLQRALPAGLLTSRIAQGLAVAALLAASWAVTYLAGGTRTAWPHLFYLPVVVAVLPFGLRGGLTAGLAATLLSGPLMPLDVADGQAQPLANWLARGGFLVGVGLLAGAGVRQLARRSASQVSQRLEADLATAARQRPATSPAQRQAVRRVLRDGAHRVVLQPIYALDDGRLFAVEALTRFPREPDQPVSSWFKAAEEAGVGRSLELATMAAALDAAEGALPAEVAVSLNATPSTLADPRLLELLDRHAHRPVIVEVTEHEVVDDYTVLHRARAALAARGVRLAVDDAGAGFASLRHIVRLEPDLIKLDRSLTQGVRRDPVRRALADSLLRFAREIDCALVSEGVETLEDLQEWGELGADAAQGFLLAEPSALPVPERSRLAAAQGLRRRQSRGPRTRATLRPRRALAS